MSNVIPMPLVSRSVSTRLRDFAKGLEPIAVCTSYVLGWVKSEALPSIAKSA